METTTFLENFNQELWIKGVAQGQEEGIAKGIYKGIYKSIINILEIRFTNVPSSLINKIELIEDERLLDEILKQSMQAKSSEDVERFVAQCETKN